MGTRGQSVCCHEMFEWPTIQNEAPVDGINHLRKIASPLFVNGALKKSYHFDWRHLVFSSSPESSVSGRVDVDILGDLLPERTYKTQSKLENAFSFGDDVWYSTRTDENGADVVGTNRVPLIFRVLRPKKEGKIAVFKKFDVGGVTEVISLSEEHVDYVANGDERLQDFNAALPSYHDRTTYDKAIVSLEWPRLDEAGRKDAVDAGLVSRVPGFIDDNTVMNAVRWSIETTLEPHNFYVVDSQAVPVAMARDAFIQKHKESTDPDIAFELRAHEKSNDDAKRAIREKMRNKKFVFFPLNDSFHWTLLIYVPRERRLYSLDSLNTGLQANPQWTYVHRVFAANGAKFKHRTAVRQKGGISCACFVMYYANYVCSTGQMVPSDVKLHGVDAKTITDFRFYLSNVLSETLVGMFGHFREKGEGEEEESGEVEIVKGRIRSLRTARYLDTKHTKYFRRLK